VGKLGIVRIGEVMPIILGIIPEACRVVMATILGAIPIHDGKSSCTSTAQFLDMIRGIGQECNRSLKGLR
jgi:hypothetical protein